MENFVSLQKKIPDLRFVMAFTIEKYNLKYYLQQTNFWTRDERYQREEPLFSIYTKCSSFILNMLKYINKDYWEPFQCLYILKFFRLSIRLEIFIVKMSGIILHTKGKSNEKCRVHSIDLPAFSIYGNFISTRMLA